MHLDYHWSAGHIGKALGSATTTIRNILVEQGVYNTKNINDKQPPVTGWYPLVHDDWKKLGFKKEQHMYTEKNRKRITGR